MLNHKKIITLSRFIYSYIYKKILKKDNDFILIPPTILNGSFGDEIMVISFINYFKSKNILLYVEKIIERDDLFSNYTNISIKSWSTYINIEKYSKLFLLGADNLSGTYGNKEVLDKIKLLKYANFYNTKISILGFSLSKNITGIVKNEFKKISNYTNFKLRDPNSFERAKKFLPEKNIYQVADLAFLCPLIKCNNEAYLRWINKQKKDNRKIIAICPNSIHMRNYKDDIYINQYVDFIKKIDQSGSYSFVLLYHDLRFLNKNWNDMIISKAIFESFNNKENIYFTDTIKNGIELKSYLPFIDLTITARMHFGISGYSLGKPMFGITYENKFSGLQKLFEIQPNRSLVDYDNIEDLINIFDLFIKDYDKNLESIERNLNSVIELSKCNFNHV